MFVLRAAKRCFCKTMQLIQIWVSASNSAGSGTILYLYLYITKFNLANIFLSTKYGMGNVYINDHNLVHSLRSREPCVIQMNWPMITKSFIRPLITI